MDDIKEMDHALELLSEAAALYEQYLELTEISTLIDVADDIDLSYAERSMNHPLGLVINT